MRIYDPQFQCDATGQAAQPQWLGDGDLEDDRVEDVPGLDAENLPHSWTEVRFTTKRPNPTHEPAMASWRAAQQTWERRIGEAVRASVMEGAARKLQRPMTDPDVEAAALEDLKDPGMVAEVREMLELQMPPPEEPNEPAWILADVILHYSPKGTFSTMRALPGMTDERMVAMAAELNLPEPKGASLPSHQAVTATVPVPEPEPEELPDLDDLPDIPDDAGDEGASDE